MPIYNTKKSAEVNTSTFRKYVATVKVEWRNNYVDCKRF